MVLKRYMIGAGRYVAIVLMTGLLAVLACSGPGHEVREQVGEPVREPAGGELSKRVNREWPRVSLPGQQRQAIEAAMRSLDQVRDPQLSVTVGIRDLERLLPDLMRSRLILPAIEGLEEIRLSGLSLRADAQALHVETRFELVLSQENLALSGTIKGAVAMALRTDQLLLFPVFSQLAIDPVVASLGAAAGAPTGARGVGYSDAQVRLISATLQRFVASLNAVALATPASLSFPLEAVDAMRAVDLLPQGEGLEVTPADRTFVFRARLGGAAILIDARGIHVLAELAPETDAAGQAAGAGAAVPAEAVQPWAGRAPQGSAVERADVQAERAAVDQAFAALAARFERIRSEHFGAAAPAASTRVLMAKPALAAILRQELGQPALCVAHRNIAVQKKRFREELRAFRKDQIRCSSARRSCDEVCRGQSAPCRVACRTENEVRVAACTTARASIRLFNGVMTLGELSGEVDVEGALELCPSTIELADDLSAIRVTGRASARAQVTARVRVDTSGIGHLACVFPFTKEFRGQAVMDQELTIASTIAPVRAADGSLELFAEIAPSPFRVTMKPTPWEQMKSDPRFALNCTFVTVALPAVSIGSALVGKKAPAGVDELTQGVYDMAMPPQRMRLRVPPLRVTLGEESLVLAPVWNDRFIGFEL